MKVVNTIPACAGGSMRDWLNCIVVIFCQDVERRP